MTKENRRNQKHLFNEIKFVKLLSQQFERLSRMSIYSTLLCTSPVVTSTFPASAELNAFLIRPAT